MLDPDFRKNHPAWKFAALLVDRLPRILYAGAAFWAIYYYGPVGTYWLAALHVRG